MMVVEHASRPATKQHGETDKDKDGKERKPRNSGDILARRRFENIRKHSARTRHRTGIVNTGEKNRLTIVENQMVKAHKVAEARIQRMKLQLRRELHEMEAGRRALRRRSICVRDEDRDRDRQDLSKYCQRGRYLYAMRNEVKTQKEDMDSYNERLEKARKMLQPAKKNSSLAMDRGKLLGLAPSNSYLKVGRRISVVEAPPAAKLLAFQDSDDDDDDIEEISKAMPVKINLEKSDLRAKSLSSTKTPPPFDVNQLRKEFGPEMRKALESLMMDDPSVMLAMPVSRETTRGSRRDFENYGTLEQLADANRPNEGSQPDNQPPEKTGDAGKLKLPPVQVEKSLVGRIPKNHKVTAAAKPLLSTVTET
ncbi:uncharacterized protein LOC129257967 [Lytechinus pictus]|uniref:uncharacterized protein LOC129257967 n=1 Tax=Lytechinus pictus TaxID=7653 RepID=UPI00240CFF2A|nr:uncharacterized protein LOC129257967 [Lytechinus pictus]